MSDLGFIGELSNAPGISGFEDDVVKILRERALGAWETREDSMRNLYFKGRQNGGKPRLMLDAHTDEVGFMVKAVRPNGTLDFIPIGGWVPQCVSAHRVLVRDNGGGWVLGLVTSRPPHFLSKDALKQQIEISDMAIDIGARSATEVACDFNISAGAPVVPDADFRYFEAGGIMNGKAFDDRLGCAAVFNVFKELAGSALGVELHGVFSSQEEVGLRGAQAASKTVKPDIAIIFEGAPADDTSGAEAHAVQTALKKGPMLRHIDAGMITNPRFQRFAAETAFQNGIPAQQAVRAGGNTNAMIAHLAEKAVPTIVIGIPVRYIHTHYGIAAYSDFEGAVKLGCEITRRLDEKTIASF